MPTIKDLLDGVIQREDDPQDPGKVTIDQGGRTQYGISERSNPDAWADGKVTLDEARKIFETKYINSYKLDLIPDYQLKNHLVDFGINSGPAIAIMKLQKILGVSQDGMIGPATLEALSKTDPKLVNSQLVRERILLIGRIVSKNPSKNLSSLNGWLDRATQFLN